MPETITRRHVIGRVSAGYARTPHSARLEIDVTVYNREGPRTLVNHFTVDEPLADLAISGGVWDNGRKDYSTCGQITDALDHMVSYAPGWNRAKVARLQEIWNRWHLNAMKAACEHQDAGAGLGSPQCELTGYEWGYRWLAEKLPDGLLDEVKEMFR